MIQSSFWVFDSLFTAQDHPVREMQDTFFINKKQSTEDKKLLNSVKEAMKKELGEQRMEIFLDEEEAKKLVLRTHTTCLSSQTLSKLKMKNFLQNSLH